jgi:hypothetical protein
MRKLMIVAAAIAAAATPALAQVSNQGGLVNVDVSNVLNNVTIKDVISKNNIPVNVLNGVAANVCGTTVALLSAAPSGTACQAKSENMTQGQARALANSILRATQQGK